MSSAAPNPTSAALVTYDVSEAWVSQTRTNFQNLTATTPAGYEEVRLAIGNVRDVRVAVEKRRAELKTDALAFGRLVDSEAKRFTNLLLEIEEPLKAKKAAVDDAAARKKAEAEAVKLREIEAEIAANRAKQEAETRAVREAEEKRIAEERARLAAERAEFEARQKAENDRVEALREAEHSRQTAEREKFAVERRVEEERMRVEREALDAALRGVTAEREKIERVEFERQAKIRAETAAAEKIERDRAEKAQREAELAALLPDLEKVEAFIAAIRALNAPDVIDPDLDAGLRFAIDCLEKVASALAALVEEAHV